MHLSLTAVLFAASVLAQTPPSSSPFTKNNLGASYKNATIFPGVWVDPNYISSQPHFYATDNQKHEPDDQSKYMIMMLDLNIPDSDVTTAADYDTLVPGLAANTTTRLHWWGGNYTLGRHGLYLNSSDALAEYTAPRPRDATNHTYTLYLFDQPESYVPPKAVLNGTLYSQTSEARFNFTLAPIVKEVGRPLAATYFLSNNV
ncbi:PEBP-like protein [Penicillium atrosanguineum]|uniref:PEBP-like protein n=1 Tax=Penicillium atrosanguineum TaxID=1132637 RepID=A0A9W9QDP5_9EURO|nr:Ceramide very long chain fatty acid hydroxylase SCS7 [Penicillium atrosanguineum]KAJ5126714.1 PEBP-like protein [Penicillium atrosanguineum]KAJ5146919.1 PEBP-like protein [Penicillium atrosanguineum]KAJ5314598.1 Ceramide very long chain fatty acid hydroxylase SCS7 [Penicillium atrosanguineum]KAJ5331769.1 PEBP-like protein [Penicillium atrosanguineum]